MKMKLENLHKANGLLIALYKNNEALKSLESSDKLFIRGEPPIPWDLVVTDPITKASIVDALRKDITAGIAELGILGFECSQEDIDNWDPANLAGSCGCG